jgi:hypothetical protein
MRRVTSSLGALLSLLVVATSVSAWTCDLTWGPRQAHSDCHIVGSAAAVNETGASTLLFV